MRFVDSRCIHCGANLRLAPDATSVCCQYCNAELQVVREGGQVSTKMMQAMQADLGGKLDILRVQNEIERLDREWNLERDKYMVTGKNGSRWVPSVFGSLFGAVALVAIGGGAFFIITNVAWGMAKDSIAPFHIQVLIGVVVIAGALFTAAANIAKATAHDSGEKRYQATRRQLLADLAEAEREQRSTRVLQS